MKKKSPARAFLWLLLIPGQLIVGTLFIALGAMLDSAMFSSAASGGAQGHGMPAFTIIFGLIAAVATLVIFILAIVLTVFRYKAIKKNNALQEKV